MKKISLFIITTSFVTGSYAQELRVGANAELSISSGTAFKFSGLTLMPASKMVLTDQYLRQGVTAVNGFANPYISRTYRFSNLPLFTGSTQVDYLDGELNGITESALLLGVYNGSTWQAIGTSTNNSTANFLLTTGINAQPLVEMIFADGVALSLKWGDVSAIRHGASVHVRWNTLQERNVSHFDVERSMDAQHWKTVISGVPAQNKPELSDYEQIDMPEYNGLLYYRIRQTDKDGSVSRSKIVSVDSGNPDISVSLSPNPANSYFTISGIVLSEISKVELLNASGALVSTWSGNQAQFDLTELPAGIYYVRVGMKAGQTISRQLFIK